MIREIERLNVYPLKGARGRECEGLVIDPTVGVVGDRRVAILRKLSSAEGWLPKAAFYSGMSAAEMVKEEPEWQESEDGVGLSVPYQIGLAERLGVNGVWVKHAGDTYNLTDDKEPYVSFLNLDTVELMEEVFGYKIDPQRFRMNVHYRGLTNFEELVWAHTGTGRRFAVNDVMFEIADVCERCKAIEANPETGVFDLNLRADIEQYMTKYGYGGSPKRKSMVVMGILARPLNAGTIHRGQQLHPMVPT